MRKQQPKPTLNPRLLVLAALLIALSVGLVIGSLIPGAVIFLAIVLGLVAGGLVVEAFNVWQKEYRAWVGKPVKRLPKMGGK
jgi:H+/Cl- antiporter ClcA